MFSHVSLPRVLTTKIGPNPNPVKRSPVMFGPTTRGRPKPSPEEKTTLHAMNVRKKVQGTLERSRLSVFRSNKHLYIQVIDDSKMHTLASASTMQKPISEEFNSSGPTIEVDKKVGEAIVQSCLERGITKVAFDRGGSPYHAALKLLLADAAREHGLLF